MGQGVLRDFRAVLGVRSQGAICLQVYRLPLPLLSGLGFGVFWVVKSLYR